MIRNRAGLAKNPMEGNVESLRNIVQTRRRQAGEPFFVFSQLLIGHAQSLGEYDGFDILGKAPLPNLQTDFAIDGAGLFRHSRLRRYIRQLHVLDQSARATLIDRKTSMDRVTLTFVSKIQNEQA
jgi:hypothetical protein